MSGYSGTPLPRKLGIKEGARVALVDAPDSFKSTLGALPDGVTVRTRARGPVDVIEDVVREIALAHRLVDNKVAAVDETWSGLQLVIRLRDR